MSTSFASLSAVRRKIEGRERISPADALLLWREATDEEMRSLASLVRARFHAPNASNSSILAKTCSCVRTYPPAWPGSV